MARIVAIAAMHTQHVAGGAPIFLARGPEELARMANLLEKVLDCAAHQVNDELFIIVDRSRDG